MIKLKNTGKRILLLFIVINTITSVHGQIDVLAYTIYFGNNDLPIGTAITGENVSQVVQIENGNFPSTTIQTPKIVNVKTSLNGLQMYYDEDTWEDGQFVIKINTNESTSPISKLVMYINNVQEGDNQISYKLNKLNPVPIDGLKSNHTYTIALEAPIEISALIFKATAGSIDVQKIEFYMKSPEPEVSIIVNPTDQVAVNETTYLKSLIIKSNKSGQTGQLLINNKIDIHDGITYEKELDDSKWYFFSLPFDCPISQATITSEDGRTWQYGSGKIGGNFIIRYHDQTKYANGAENGWTDYDWQNKPLKAKQGYIIGLFPAGSTATIKFKSAAPYTLNPPQEEIFDFGEGYSWYTFNETVEVKYSGWNLIGSPYYHNMRFGTITHTTGEYSNSMLSIPNPDGITYTQVTLSNILQRENIKPFSSYFIQVGSEASPVFNSTTSNPDLIAQPFLRAPINRKSWTIRLEDQENRSDETTILSVPGKTTAYEIGHDLMKMKGKGEIPQIYSIEGNDELAFNAQDIESSKEIRLGIYVPHDGEYTFSLPTEETSSRYSITLYDKEKNIATDLKSDRYTTTIQKGEDIERFEINIYKQGELPTNTTYSEIETANIYKSQDGIIHIDGLKGRTTITVYDSTGRTLHIEKTDKSHTTYIPASKGLYLIKIENATSSTTKKIIQ